MLDVADKFAKCQGVFTVKNGRWTNGKQHYRNSNGSWMWFCANSWRIQPSIWIDATIEADTAEDVICPATVTKWKWTTNHEKNVKWNHAEVSITCSSH